VAQEIVRRSFVEHTWPDEESIAFSDLSTQCAAAALRELAGARLGDADDSRLRHGNGDVSRDGASRRNLQLARTGPQRGNGGEENRAGVLNGASHGQDRTTAFFAEFGMYEWQRPSS
jgi:hypothetical protein